jgi:hypothetical protein
MAGIACDIAASLVMYSKLLINEIGKVFALFI